MTETQDPSDPVEKTSNPEQDQATETLLETESETAPQESPEASAANDTPPAAEDRVKDMEQQYLRLRADFDNFRKRTAREKQEWNQRALENLAQDLLIVLDHFDLGLQTAEKAETPPAVLDGFRMVHQQLFSSLAKYEIKPIETEGKAFDHAWHEAITTMPSTEVAADHVLAQVKRGYRIGDRLLRAAQVVVSSGAAEAATGGEEPEV